MPTVKSQIEDLYHKLQLITQQIGPAGTVTDQGVTLDVIGAATYTNLHQWLNNTCSAMRITGGLITDSGAGQIDVAAGKGILKTTDDPIGENRQFDWGAELNLALADNDTSWVGIEYNAGAPQVKINTNLANFNFRTDFILGRVYRAGATVMILNAGSYYDNFQHRVCYRIFEVAGFRRVTGGIIADEGLLDFSITEGAWYCGTTRFTTAAWDCSGADTFTYWYRDGGGGWTTVAAQADINNLKYDDGVPPLGNLGVGRFGVHWVYLAHDGSVHVQYGQGNYKHFEAEAALVPAGPDFFAENCVLVGKIIVGQNNATLTDVLSAFEVIFIGAAASLHNDLGGLQGGQADQYYHLNAAEHGFVSGVNAQSVLMTASPSFVNISLGVGELTCGSINRAAGTLTLEVGGVAAFKVENGAAANTLVVNANSRVGVRISPSYGFHVKSVDSYFVADTTNVNLYLQSGTAAGNALFRIKASDGDENYYMGTLSDDGGFVFYSYGIPGNAYVIAYATGNVTFSYLVGIGGTTLATCDLTLRGTNPALGLKETTTPAANAGYGKLYTKADDLLYFQSGDGVEHTLMYAP